MVATLTALLLLAAPIELGPALDFATPATCGPGVPLRTIVDQMQLAEQGSERPPIAVPGFATPLRQSVIHFQTGASAQGMTLVALIMVGRWHGLRVVRLEHWFEVGTPRTSVRIEFEDSAERARTVLNAAGFDLGPVGSQRSFQVEGRTGRIGIQRVGNESNLFCDFL